MFNTINKMCKILYKAKCHDYVKYKAMHFSYAFKRIKKMS